MPLNTPTIEDAKALNGKDVAMLSQSEKTTYKYMYTHGRKLGVAISTISEAPKEELSRANSNEQYEDIIKRYPSRITVTTSK